MHMVTSMKAETGRMAVVLPHGVLFRSGAEAKIRKKLLDIGAIESVIGLAGNLFYGTGIPACILILRKTKRDKTSVLFINAEEIFTKGRAQNTMSEDQADEIYQIYRDQLQKSHEQEGISRWVEYSELKENDFNLNIARYVQKPLEEETITVEEALRDFKQKLVELEHAEDELELLLEKEGFEL
jgi:type I restriction enzyme M protein